MKKDRKGLRHLCAQVHDEDGHRPERRDAAASAAGRKDLQLCKQVLRALGLHIAGAAWAAQVDLMVDSVVPDPDATRLRVHVRWKGISVHEAMALLGQRRSELRTATAQAITRKRTPQLVFAPAQEEVQDE